MTDNKPLFRRIIDAIHALQDKTATLHEASAAWVPAWPDCVSLTPRGGTAITPRHAVFANHYPLKAGDVLLFGEEVRKITRATAAADDIGIAEWDEPIQATPMKLLPWDWQRRISVQGDGKGRPITPLPVWRCSQDFKVSPDFVGIMDETVYLEPASSKEGWFPVRVGDSGMPVFIGGRELILLCCLEVKYGGPALRHYASDVLRWAPAAKQADWSW